MFARILIRLFGGIWSVKNKAKVNKFYKSLYDYYQFEHGSSVSVDSSFANEPLFPRGMKQIIIGDGVIIGKNCVIYQQVTIDAELLPFKNTENTPKIGNNCYIYPGAKIIGNVTIGDNVSISPNAVVVEDIPDNSNV